MAMFKLERQYRSAVVDPGGPYLSHLPYLVVYNEAAKSQPLELFIRPDDNTNSAISVIIQWTLVLSPLIGISVTALIFRRFCLPPRWHYC